MPGVTLLPTTPGLGGSPHSMPNGFARPNDSLTVSEIKEKAKEHVQKEARGVAALSLIRTARTQSIMARESELKGDLKGALSAVTKAAALAQMCVESAEFIAERRGKRGVLQKEFMEFMEQYGSNLPDQGQALESKLTEIEKVAHVTNGTGVDDGPIQKAGGSIADRVRKLQDSGMAVSTTKRFSMPTTPVSPKSHPFTRPLSQAFSSPPVAPSSLTPVTPISSASSPHAFVSPSTLGPPSPSSSPSSSPRLPTINLSDFAQAFPSIDELDELHGLQLQSVPTGTGDSGKLSSLDVLEEEPSPPPASIRPFPVLSVDLGPRPSSTPITPTISTLGNSPPSPAHPSIKPSTLSWSTKAPAPPKSPLPVSNIVHPKPLHTYMNEIGFKVLLLDVRTRAEFEKEHIRGDAVVCLEPSVLMRDNVSGKTLEDSLSVAPRSEWSLFCNRDKFDLVAIYDDSSISPGSHDSPISTLVRAIYEQSFVKILKTMPMLLVGGLEAWKQQMGETEIVRGAAEILSPEVHKPPVGAPSPMLASVSTLSSPAPDPHEVWTPRARADTTSTLPDKESFSQDEARPSYSQNQSAGMSRSIVGAAYVNGQHSPETKLLQKPVSTRPPNSISVPSPYPRIKSDNMSSPTIPSMINGSASIQYPLFGKSSVPPSSFTPSGNFSLVSPPPTASVNHSLTRRRSDYIDQSQEALSGISSRPSIDYPELSTQHILRPPPAAASSALERQDNRPRLAHTPSFSNAQPGPKPPRISSDWPVTYWSDIQIGISGLKNLGNTCYMNSTIQCLSATVPFSRFFTDGRWKNAVNCVNPLGTKGKLAYAFAKLLLDMWHGEHSYITPYEFRGSICTHAERFRGSDQHDSQEFLSFLLDGLHEDLNRVLNKPVWAPSPEREAELERLPQQVASEQEWRLWRNRNDSVIVDFFQGQFRNRLECMTCHKTSTTYDPFTSLPLPVPTGRSGKVSLQQCLDAFVKTEVMEKNDAWRCPHCKELRKTTKQLSLSRLPPVLIIHLKRFSFEGRWTDKIDTFVDFPLKSLDLTNYMPPPLPPGAENTQLNGITLDDPRSQMPPYRYDLYGVTNHFGSLSSGHYTAFISSRGGWVYCDDSSVKPTDAREVVGKPAYILFYKRTKV